MCFPPPRASRQVCVLGALDVLGVGVGTVPPDQSKLCATMAGGGRKLLPPQKGAGRGSRPFAWGAAGRLQWSWDFGETKVERSQTPSPQLKWSQMRQPGDKWHFARRRPGRRLFTEATQMPGDHFAA